ncbi:hypothetical protein F8M49_23610 [Rhodococcus zopfii]|uniref:Uncharacterized protein n=1 Tax=Rhodococcus zopfii TaxID=43772 RepID=A0ABU3WUD7_9NOCA|nr:hypothetical protein [Rhodococcus zopfii]
MLSKKLHHRHRRRLEITDEVGSGDAVGGLELGASGVAPITRRAVVRPPDRVDSDHRVEELECGAAGAAGRIDGPGHIGHDQRAATYGLHRKAGQDLGERRETHRSPLTRNRGETVTGLGVGFDVRPAGGFEECLHTSDGVYVLLEDFGEPAGADGFVIELLAEGLCGGEVTEGFLALKKFCFTLQLIEDDEEVCAGLCAGCGRVGFEEQKAFLGISRELGEQRLWIAHGGSSQSGI